MLLLRHEKDIMLMQRINKTGEVIQTLYIRLMLVLVLCWGELTASRHSTLDWAVTEASDVKPCAYEVDI